MAWNPEPKVAAARDYAEKFDAECVVIVSICHDGSCSMVSYGETRALCEEAKALSLHLHDKVQEYYDPDSAPLTDNPFGYVP